MPAAKIISTLLLTGLLISHVSAFKFSSISGYEGSVYNTFEDSKGRVWFGTTDGLVFYDGYEFQWFKHNESDSSSLSSNQVQSFYEDKQGNFWIGTKDGLNYFNPNTGKCTRYLPSNSGISHHRVRDIIPENDSILWIGTYGGGINRLNVYTKHFEVLTTKSGLTSDLVNALFIENDTTLWIGTEQGGLSKMNLTTRHFHHFLPQDSTIHGFSDISVSCIKKIEGQLWIGSWHNGLYKKHKHQNVFEILPLDFFSDYKKSDFQKIVRCFTVDKQGNWWIGTGNSLNYKDATTGQLRIFRHQNNNNSSIPTGRIWSVMCDKSGNIWSTYLHGGVCKFDYLENKLTPVYFYENNKATKADGFTSSHYLDASGNYWLGSYQGALKCYKLSNKQLIKDWSSYFETGEIIYDINQRALQEIWVCTSIGLHIIKNNTHRFYNKDEVTQNNKSLISAGFYHVEFDKNNNAYLCGWNSGVVEIPQKIADAPTIDFSKTIIYASFNSLLEDDKIWSILTDSKNRLWISSDGGCYLLQNRKLQKTDNAKDVFALTELEDKTILRGHTNGWIDQWDGQKWMPFLDLSAYCSRINSLFQWDKKWLYIGTMQGLVIVNLENKKTTFLDTDDGLESNDMGFKAPIVWNNQLVFITHNGLSSIPISTTMRDTVAPLPVLNAVEIKDREDKKINPKNRFELAHNQNKINFTFGARHYSKTQKVIFEYLLKGHDNHWNRADAFHRKAGYAALAPGSYSFLIKACNADGVWSEAIVLYQFTIHPPWWKMWWAYVLYLLLFGALLYVLNTFTLIKVKAKNELKLQRLLREKDAELQQLKLNFFTNISHELRTPLTLILGPVQKIVTQNNLDASTLDRLKTVERNAQHLLNLVTELLEFRKITHQHIELAKNNTELSVFVKDIAQHYEALSELKNITLTLLAEPGIYASIDRQKMQKVIHNLLANAFKHTPENGQIDLTIKENNESIVLTLTDSGPGVAAHIKPHVFEQFSSTDQNGIGIGLALAHEIVVAHGGTLQLLPSPNGACFQVSLTREEKQKEIEIEALPYPSTKKENTILLVEDNPEIGSYIQSLLAKDYHVLWAKNGIQGIAIAQSEELHLILSDVMMPEMDGITFCKHIKTDAATSHIPVLLLTARTSVAQQLEGLEAQADDYITKPFNEDVLLQKIKNILQNRYNWQQKFKLNAQLELPPEKHLLSSDEQLVTQLIELIKTNLTNNQLSVEWLSRELGMNRSHLTRKIKAISGSSPMDFITSIRLKKAITLLESGAKNVSEVAYEVGFSNPRYFSTAMKNQFGKSPGEYLKR